MPAIHIRNVPLEVLEALKRRAAINDRSLQQEMRHVLKQLAQQAPAAEPVQPIDLKFSDAEPETTWRREEIYGDDGR